MEKTSRDFLDSLLNTPSPSGFERPIQDIVRRWAEPLCDELKTDPHGNVIAARNPDANFRIMLAGHCDQIGLMVQYIDDQGFLYVQPIGGWDMQILLGQHLTVWGKGGPIVGVVSRRAPHLMNSDERNKVPQFTDVWVDIGANDKEEVEKIIDIGDPATCRLGPRNMRNGLITGPGMDDRVGVWVVMEALRLLKDRTPKSGVFAVSTVQEEIGLRGATTSAYGINPDIGIAVDVSHATDTPGTDKKQIGDCAVGKGPAIVRGPNINPHVFSLLVETAKKNDIPYQIKSHPKGTGTDANAIQLSREGVAAALVGIPNRYMHSPVEVVSLDDLQGAARLLAEFCVAAKTTMNLTP